MEREEEELRRLKLNPVFRDGGQCPDPHFHLFSSVLLTVPSPPDFQYRAPREIEPHSLRGVGPLVLSTF